MSGIVVLGAITFNIGHMQRSVLLAELGNLVGQIAVGCATPYPYPYPYPIPKP